MWPGIVLPTGKNYLQDPSQEVYQSIIKKKERSRSFVLGSRIDKDAGKKSRECYGCQVVVRDHKSPSAKLTRMPESGWRDLALDLLALMPTGEHLVLLVNCFIRWLDVDIMQSSCSEVIIKHYFMFQLVRY